MLGDDFFRSVLEDPRVRRFQEAVPKNTNGDPHIFVRALAEDERGAPPADVLGRALGDGSIDEAIVAQNVALGWMSFEADLLDSRRREGAPPTFVRSGHRLELTQVSAEAFRSFLQWSLKTPQAHSHHDRSSPEEADETIGAVLEVLHASAERDDAVDWQYWRLKPDFLHAADGEVVTSTGDPVFFDHEGKNYAWMGQGPERFFLILLTVYPCPNPFDRTR